LLKNYGNTKKKLSTKPIFLKGGEQ